VSISRAINRLTAWLFTLWRADRALTATGLMMLAALVVFTAGLILDPRTIQGAPAWLKPAKFAASIAIYTLTLAWVFTYLPAWVKTRRLVSWIASLAFILEIVIIAVQAWRGTTSHFNVGTRFDAILWTTMGTAIAVQTLTSIAVVVALWRQPFTDRPLGSALRLGLLISIIGASAGGLMTQPTAEQLAEARLTGRFPIAGAHTVGGPDGGPGLPGTGWSLEHGDIRVGHFIGLHAFQMLPLLALFLRARRWPERTRVRLVFIATGSYMALFAILLWQGMRGQSVIAPDVTTFVAFAVWIVVTLSIAWIAALKPSTARALMTQ
jgi:hypothetical protein